MVNHTKSLNETENSIFYNLFWDNKRKIEIIVDSITSFIKKRGEQHKVHIIKIKIFFPILHLIKQLK